MNLSLGMNPSEFASLLTSFRGGPMQGLQRGRPSNSNTTSSGTTRMINSLLNSTPSSSATVPTASTNSKPNSAVQMSALTNVLSNLSNPTTQETATPPEKPSKSTADLHDLLDSEVRFIRYGFISPFDHLF